MSATAHRETRSLQIWPSGESFQIAGDVHGPADQRQLKARNDADWRDGTAEEWRKIRIALRAELYAANYIKGCDSAIVDDLIKAAGSGELSGDLREAFSYDEIRNIYADPSDWDAERCREYANDHDINLPGIPMTDCDDCDDDARQGGDTCQTCYGSGEVPQDDYEEDDSRYGWLTEARDACREYAQDNPAEPYEWWRVDSWLCRQLHYIGEVTIDNGYGCWWGRQCTGQQYIMDGTLQTIAAQFEQEDV